MYFCILYIKSDKINFYQGRFMSEKNKNKYRPINCSFYDLLLALATQRKPVNLVYWQDKTPQNVSGSVIKDVYTKKGMEFMELSSGEVIRLDRVIYAGLTKKDLPRGYSRQLTKQEIIMLKHFI